MPTDLSTQLRALATGTARSVAVGLVDLSREPQTFTAVIDADESTRFEIGSVSKAMTGMLLAEAVARGEVTLATTLGSTLPTIGPELDAVTVAELATHTSGLPRLPGGPASAFRTVTAVALGRDPFRGITASDVLAAASRQHLSDRGAYRYSNLGAAVLGQLLASVADTDFSTLLGDRLFDPLGMPATSVGSHGRPAPAGWASKHRRSQPWLLDGYAPAGGVVSTLPDMMTFLTAVVAGSAPGLASLDPIAGAASEVAGRASGMFWVVDTVPGSGRTMVWHNGQTGGYSSFLAVFPQARRGVVVLADIADAPALRRIADGLVRWLVAG
jgi:CubicO group peptidase (beta-lactamase class C family)